MSPGPPRPGDAVRVSARSPEPAGLWIRYAPRDWPAPGGPWLDLGGGGIEGLGSLPAAGGGVGAPARLPDLSGGPFDDVVWLPPVPPPLRPDRDRLAARLLAAGTPVLIQAFPGEVPAAAGAVVLVDLTPVLLHAALGREIGAVAGDRADRDPGPPDEREVGTSIAAETAPAVGGPSGRSECRGDGEAEPGVVVGAVPPFADRSPVGSGGQGEPGSPPHGFPPGEPFGPRTAEAWSSPSPAVDPLAHLPAGAAVLWPLVPGLTDLPDFVSAGLDRLAAAGVAVVQPTTPRLAPADRRRLAEAAGEAVFDRLFHGAPPDERAFARAVAARGMAFLLPRPLPRPPLAGAGNRRIAAALATAGELWLRLGRAPSQGQAFFRAARWADETGYDLRALAREGNLGVVAAIDPPSRALIEEAAATGGEPALVGELIREWLAEEERET